METTSTGTVMVPSSEANKLIRYETDKRIGLLREEYQLKANDIKLRAECLQREYGFCAAIMERSVPSIDHAEEVIASLTFETLEKTSTLKQFADMFGDKQCLQAMVEVMKYHLNESAAKSKPESLDLFKLAKQTYISNPTAKLMELVYVMRKGCSGQYGETYHRIDTEVFSGWWKQYWEEQSEWRETKVIAAKPTATNHGKLVDPHEKKMENYRQEVRDKLKIREEETRKANA